jgi:D-glycerate 3-kinase
VVVAQVLAPLALRICEAAARHGSGFVAGLCGPQGAGKSTIASALLRLIEDRGRSAAVLSLDDLYLGRAERDRLAETTHPLLAVRGPPGTHDVAAGCAVLDALGRPGEVRIPRFDKAADEPRPRADWPAARAPVDVVLFEGWCVGARPQPIEALAAPVNDLERRKDPDGVWRRFVNDALAGPYQALFSRVGLLILLQAPGFEVVAGWRAEQEAKLRARLEAAGAGPGATMSEAEVAVFVQHYERITRHILSEGAGWADVVVRLDQHRRPVVSSLT